MYVWMAKMVSLAFRRNEFEVLSKHSSGDVELAGV